MLPVDRGRAVAISSTLIESVSAARVRKAGARY